MIILIDNYDSFSYNLYQLIGTIYPAIEVVRNDAMTVAELQDAQPDALILSPGPGRPADAGICEDAVRQLSGTIPILGVCLGHQAIVEALGGTVDHARNLMHGKSSQVVLDTDSPLFADVASPIIAGRYHSLSAVKDLLPSCLKVTATASDGEVMAVEHRQHPTFGLQFHPECIMTPAGHDIVQNFINLCHPVKSTKGESSHD